MPEQLSDAVLLERYVSRREEAAFLALVERHGPRVEGICRRLLRNEHDVADVSQATFFILARKAAVISWRESVGGWLCSVAHRLAMGARAETWRHQQRETSFTTLARRGTTDGDPDGAGAGGLPEKYHPLCDSSGEIEWRELRRVLDEELMHLPHKYRAPVVLCDLQGRTHAEAARQLGCPAGSMSRRLERARALLRRRLIHRGVAPVISLIGFALLVLGTWSIAQKGAPSAVAIGRLMSPLEPLSHTGSGEQGILSRMDGPLAPPDLDQILKLAREATRIAAEIERHDPGKNQDLWQTYAVEMRLSAGLLAQATQDNNPTGMILAARRLDASCRNCHAVFR
jgi:RNA polymerase sigma-70 factor (ECF subfamily)